MKPTPVLAARARAAPAVTPTVTIASATANNTAGGVDYSVSASVAGIALELRTSPGGLTAATALVSGSSGTGTIGSQLTGTYVLVASIPGASAQSSPVVVAYASGANPGGTGLLIGPLTSAFTPAFPSSPYWDNSASDNFAIITDPTSPTGYSVRGTYTSGPEFDNTVYAVLGTGRSKLYMRTLFKMGSDWPAGSTRKVLQWRLGFEALLMILDVLGSNWSLFQPATGTFVADNAHSEYGPMALAGTWVDLGYLTETSGGNQRHRIWVNGSLEIDYSDTHTFSASTAMFGGPFNAPAGNTHDWYANCAVYTGASGV